MLEKTFPYGHSIETTRHLVFFANKLLDLRHLTNLFPYHFLEVQQTHSDILITHGPTEVSEKQIGDAHSHQLHDMALLIKTADCMPIFITNPDSEHFLAIHAGWRGIQNQITIKAIKKTFSSFRKLNVYIGAYIHQTSFEVEQTVCDEILATVKEHERPACFFYNDKTKKFHIDLKLVLLHHLHTHFPNKTFEFTDLEINTFNDFNYHSYRRDKATSGRNYSFIVKKKD